MTTAQAAIKKRVMRWTSTAKVEFAESLLESVEGFTSPEIERAWGKEIASRINDIENGTEEGIPGEKVMSEAKRMLREARRLPSVRRKRTG